MSDVFAIYRCKACGKIHSRTVFGLAYEDGELKVLRGFDLGFYENAISIECESSVTLNPGEKPKKMIVATAEYIGLAVDSE